MPKFYIRIQESKPVAYGVRLDLPPVEVKFGKFPFYHKDLIYKAFEVEASTGYGKYTEVSFIQFQERSFMKLTKIQAKNLVKQGKFPENIVRLVARIEARTPPKDKIEDYTPHLKNLPLWQKSKKKK